MHDVEAHVAGTDHSDKRVHVRTVIVEKPAASVDELGYLPYLLFEKSESIGVRHHDTGDVVSKQRLEVGDVHQSIRIRLHHDYFQATDGSAGRIGTVRAVRYDDLGPIEVSAKKMILPHDHKAGQLSVGACARVEGEPGHSRKGGEGFLHIVVHLKGTLDGAGRLERMQGLEALHPSNLLVDLGIVLHRAASQRIEPGVNAEVHLGEVGVVTYNVYLAHLRQGGSLASEQVCRDRSFGRLRNLSLSKGIACTAILREFEYKFVVILHIPRPPSPMLRGRRSQPSSFFQLYRMSRNHPR